VWRHLGAQGSHNAEIGAFGRDIEISDTPDKRMCPFTEFLHRR
jgi:hypothetical protein